LGPKISQLGTSDFAITFWFQTKADSRLFDILGDRTAGSHGNFICIRMTGRHEKLPEGQISVEIDQDDNGKNYIGIGSSKSELNDGKWHYVATVRQGRTLKLYIDGESCGAKETNGVANIFNQNDFRLGKTYHDFPGVEIKFKDLKIYEGVLSDEELASLFKIK